MKDLRTNASRKSICISPHVIEKVAELRKTGIHGAFMADRAEAIIARLKSGGCWQEGRKLAGCTRNGEKRIRKCVKYDLGRGYRLVTLLRGDFLFICCLGTHDECDRWLNQNSRTIRFEMPNALVWLPPPKAVEIESSSSEEAGSPNEPDDLDRRLQKLPDRSLRKIFCGLVEAQRHSRTEMTKVYG